jgi:hypothetical protein
MTGTPDSLVVRKILCMIRYPDCLLIEQMTDKARSYVPKVKTWLSEHRHTLTYVCRQLRMAPQASEPGNTQVNECLTTEALIDNMRAYSSEPKKFNIFLKHFDAGVVAAQRLQEAPIESDNLELPVSELVPSISTEQLASAPDTAVQSPDVRFKGDEGTWLSLLTYVNKEQS